MLTRNEVIQKFLFSCRELNAFCTQNGWIDNESLTFEIAEQTTDYSVVSVKFIEVIMEGAGCIADRISCFGRLKLFFDTNGQIITVQID